MVSNGLPPIPLLHETVWLDSSRYQEAERQYHELESSGKCGSASGTSTTPETCSQVCGMSKPSLACEIAHARQKIQNFLKKSGDTGVSNAERSVSDIQDRLKKLERDRIEMNKEMEKMQFNFIEVFNRISTLESFLQKENIIPASLQGEKKVDGKVQNGPAADDDDIDLFGSDEETEEDIKLKEARVKAYAEKKAKKPALVAKSSVVLDVKPWDDETDMKAMETAVRQVKSDGLVWGASKLVPLAYGINKLQIVAVVEDDKVSIDWLQETIQEIEELVQSVDIAAFNKL